MWQQCTERITVKNITTDDHGHVSLAWQSTGSTDDGLSLLDEVWETKMPTAGASSKGPNKRPKAVADEDEGVSKKGKTPSGMSSSGETQPGSKRAKVSTVGKQTSAKTNKRSIVDQKLEWL